MEVGVTDDSSWKIYCDCIAVCNYIDARGAHGGRSVIASGNMMTMVMIGALGTVNEIVNGNSEEWGLCIDKNGCINVCDDDGHGCDIWWQLEVMCKICWSVFQLPKIHLQRRLRWRLIIFYRWTAVVWCSCALCISKKLSVKSLKFIFSSSLSFL